jgi:flagellar hook-associated protein 3 FlgL
VASTNIRQAGTDTITYGGAPDAFQTLAGLRDDLRNARGLNPTAQLKSVANRIGELSQVGDNVVRVIGQQSASLQNLSRLQSQVQDVQLETKKLTGDVQSADIAGVLTSLQAQQNLFQATLLTTAQLFNLSLLNFIK